MKQNSDICPDCGQEITLKLAGDSLLCFEPDGTVHHCNKDPKYSFDPKPIGQAIEGKTISSFHVRRRIATLILSDSCVLEVFAIVDNTLVPVSLRLVSPEGILEER